MLTAAEKAQMQAVEEASMTELATIRSKVRVSDGAGGNLLSESVQENVPCKRWARIGQRGEQPFGGTLVEGLIWMMAFPVGTVIHKDDEIDVGADHYNVVSLMAPETYETARVVVVTRR